MLRHFLLVRGFLLLSQKFLKITLYLAKFLCYAFDFDFNINMCLEVHIDLKLVVGEVHHAALGGLTLDL